MDKDKRAKIIDYITPLNDGHGHSLQEKVKALDYVLKGDKSYSTIRNSEMECIRCNQGSFGDGRSIANSDLILWVLDIVERWQ